MRMLLGALALAASFLQTDSRNGQVQTLYTSAAHQTIAAFAQDGGLLAWFAPNSKRCNLVWLWQLGSAQQSLPAQGAKYHNVTCHWQVPAGSPVGVAVATNGGAPAVLWTLHESAAQALRFDYVLGATVRDPNERRFQEVAHANRGAGQWLSGIAGSGTTLVYAVAEVQYEDQVACLSTPKAPGACALEISGGGIFRIVGRNAPLRVRGASAAVAVAAAGDDVAYVPAAAAAAADGHPLPSADAPVDVRNAATGELVTSVVPGAQPIAIGLSSTVLALLSRSGDRLMLDWYDVPAGRPAGSLLLPKRAEPAIAVGDRTIVFRVGRSIRTVDVRTKQVDKIATAAATPIGLSIAGSRVAWAENVGERGRIRAVTLAP
jgi:hypothetical protein